MVIIIILPSATAAHGCCICNSFVVVRYIFNKFLNNHACKVLYCKEF